MSDGKRYFTGKPCPNGHVAERYASTRACVACAAEKKRLWAGRNKDRVSAYNKRVCPRYYEATKEYRSAKFEEWKAANRTVYLSRKADDYRQHRARYNAAAKAWRLANLEIVRESNRQKRAANPEQYAAYSRNRKHRVRNAQGSHTGDDVQAIFAAQKGRCAYCREPITMRAKHVDHILPLARGGTNDRRNLQITCAGCNQRKHTKHPVEFAREVGLLI